MTWVDAISYQQVGDLDSLRNWVEYGFKQSQNELGWAEFRVTDDAPIKKWWESVMSTDLMVTLNTPPMPPEGTIPLELSDSIVVSSFPQQASWETGNSWKNGLNNRRLILLPWVSFNLLKPWLKVFPRPELTRGFQLLIRLMK